MTARLTDSGLLVSLEDAVPEKIVSINRLLPIRTRDDFIPMLPFLCAESRIMHTRLSKFLDDNQQKKSQVTPGAAKD